MPPVVLAILKYLFLLLIFLFLIRAVRVMLMEIAGPRATRSPAASRASATAVRPKRPPERLAVIPPEGKTQIFDLGDELIIGRGDRCHVVIHDSYASQIHARVFRKGDAIFIEDMGSTNGTYLNRRKVGSALEVTRGDKIRIGKTQLEFRR